jgi:Flp pilus assembly protein protease CpaA
VDVAQPRVVGSGTLRKDRDGSVRCMVIAALMGAGAAALADPPPAVATTAAALTVIVRADLRERRIPTPVVRCAVVVVAAALVSAAATSGEWARLAWSGLLAAGVVALFTLAWLVEAVGFGDVRLAFMVTMTAGWHNIEVVAALWWWASVAALAWSIAARCRGIKEIACAPAIALGWALAVLPAG